MPHYKEVYVPPGHMKAIPKLEEMGWVFGDLIADVPNNVQDLWKSQVTTANSLIQESRGKNGTELDKIDENFAALQKDIARHQDQYIPNVNRFKKALFDYFQECLPETIPHPTHVKLIKKSETKTTFSKQPKSSRITPAHIILLMERYGLVDGNRKNNVEIHDKYRITTGDHSSILHVLRKNQNLMEAATNQ